MIMKRKLPRKQSAKVSLKNGRKKDPISRKRCQCGCNTFGKTPYSVAMYVDNELKQMDARSRTITEKRIMDIVFQVEMGTTCGTPTQRQHSSDMRPAEAQYSNATTPVQGQYSSGTPEIQNFWMDLLHND